MPDSRVLQTAARLGVAEEVVGVAQGLAEKHAVGAGAAGAHQECCHVLQRQRSPKDRIHLVADVCVFVIPGIATPGLFG